MKSVFRGPVRGHVQVELLSAYLDQQASPAERAYVDAHLQQCMECRAELDSLRRTADYKKKVDDAGAALARQMRAENMTAAAAALDKFVTEFDTFAELQLASDEQVEALVRCAELEDVGLLPPRGRPRPLLVARIAAHVVATQALPAGLLEQRLHLRRIAELGDLEQERP